MTGQQLRALRALTGLNQRRFGRKLGVSLNSMSNYESGKRKITRHFAIAAHCVVHHQHLAQGR